MYGAFCASRVPRRAVQEVVVRLLDLLDGRSLGLARAEHRAAWPSSTEAPPTDTDIPTTSALAARTAMNPTIARRRMFPPSSLRFGPARSLVPTDDGVRNVAPPVPRAGVAVRLRAAGAVERRPGSPRPARRARRPASTSQLAATGRSSSSARSSRRARTRSSGRRGRARRRGRGPRADARTRVTRSRAMRPSSPSPISASVHVRTNVAVPLVEVGEARRATRGTASALAVAVRRSSDGSSRARSTISAATSSASARKRSSLFAKYR